MRKETRGVGESRKFMAPVKSQDRTGVPGTVPEGAGTGSTIFGSSARGSGFGGLASSVGSGYPRKGLGFLKEKRGPRKRVQQAGRETYQDGGNGAGWFGGSQWFLGLKPERWFQGTGYPPIPAEHK